MCAPFWWSVAKPEDTAARILHNGTICYVDTGSRRIGITASHVYIEYLADKENHGAEAIECQFGDSTIYPEKHVIADSERWDIATFDLPDVFVGGAIRNRKSYHHAVRWPPQCAQKSDAVIFGGFPGVLREEKGSTADLPFQWVAVLSSLPIRKVLILPFREGRQPLSWVFSLFFSASYPQVRRS